MHLGREHVCIHPTWIEGVDLVCSGNLPSILPLLPRMSPFCVPPTLLNSPPTVGKNFVYTVRSPAHTQSYPGSESDNAYALSEDALAEEGDAEFDLTVWHLEHGEVSTQMEEVSNVDLTEFDDLPVQALVLRLRGGGGSSSEGEFEVIKRVPVRKDVVNRGPMKKEKCVVPDVAKPKVNVKRKADKVTKEVNSFKGFPLRARPGPCHWCAIGWPCHWCMKVANE